MATMTRKKMTKAQMRVAIAKDVIEHVKAKKIVATQGVFCKPVRGHGYLCQTFNGDEIGKDLRAILPTVAKQCDVCAKGALFYAHVMRFNNVKTPEWIRNKEVCAPLAKYFAGSQLKIIDRYFETSDVIMGQKRRTEDAIEYQRKYPVASNRLIAIMRNIIKNKGTFLPTAKPRTAEMEGK